MVCIILWISSLVFFFQAEDGIRYLTVTGVQTCALPICPLPHPLRRAGALRQQPRAHAGTGEHLPELRHGVGEPLQRSEERRVGKECICLWSAFTRLKIVEIFVSVSMTLILFVDVFGTMS